VKPKTIYFLVISFSIVASTSAADVYTLINKERLGNSLPKLSVNTKLVEAARMHADWMATTGQFSHLEGEEPKTKEQWEKSRWHPLNRVIQTGYVDFSVISQPDANRHASEIIAHGSPNSGKSKFNPKVIVDGWIKSPGHHKIMLGDYKEFGATKKIFKGHVYWVVVFGNK